MTIAVHVPYSPDLSPSDLCLFGHEKGLLRGGRLRLGTLLSAVEGILGSLERWTLMKAFREWMRRPDPYIETDDDYAW
jgi:hypothetical protein